MQTQVTNKIDFTGKNLFIGLDVHKKSWSVTIVVDGTEHRTFTQPPDPESLNSYLHRMFPGGTYNSAYEAGFCGYGIHRWLNQLGINNIVINAADIPTSQKDKLQKRDPVDSRKIARSLEKGSLHGIHIFYRELEEMRSLNRTRFYLMRDLRRNKNRIKSFLQYYGEAIPNCWAHARRKFNEALKEDKGGAEYALEKIGLLYGVETMADDQELDYQQQAELRTRLAYPILRTFEKWIVSYMPKALPKGRMSQALTYTYSLFHRLSRYHLDGRYKIDNNLVGNTIRPLALGRKSYMFCGNHDAAENAAIMYSLLGCCAASDVNPREWLTDLLTKIPYYNNDYSLDLAELLPHNWKAGRELQKAPLEIQ